MKRILCLIAVAVSPVMSPGAEKPPHHIATGTNVVAITPALINALAEEARTNNPALRAAGSRADAATLNVASVRQWEDPTVSFGTAVASARGFKTSEEGDLIYGVQQKLPLFGKPQIDRNAALTEADTERANVEFQVQSVRRDVAKAVFEVALASRVLDIGAQDLAWIDTMAKLMEERYRVGSATLTDVLRIQNERAKRAEQLRTDETMREHAQLALNRLLNRDLHTAWPILELPAVAKPIEYSERLVALALQSEPKLKWMQRQVKQAEAVTLQTERKRLPDVSVGVEGRQYSGDGGFREGMFSVSLNFPWGNAEKYRNDLRRDWAKLSAAEHDAADYQLSVREHVHHFTVDIDAARREAVLYRDEIIPRGEQALDSARAAWEVNRGMLNDVLEARRMVLEGRLMYARAVAEQFEMMAELVLTCGLDDLAALDRINGQPQVKALPNN